MVLGLTDPLVVKEEEMGRASRTGLQHDPARGEPCDYDLWDDDANA
ncbi:hypothetical protein [Nonomuraea solani]|nr:hypothetical protein [Nonomuraea solani]